jgi:hypothetical protein
VGAEQCEYAVCKNGGVTGHGMGATFSLRVTGAAHGLGHPLARGLAVQVSDPGSQQFMVEGRVHRGLLGVSSVGALSRGWGEGDGARIGQPRRFQAAESLDSRARALGLLGIEQAGLFGKGGGLHPVGDAELAQDAGDMHAGGLRADVQLGADLRVGAPGPEQAQY